MDINATINWHPGMELTAQAFRLWDERLDYRQRVALRSALGSHSLGLLPDAPFECKAMFVKNQLEIRHLRCMAVLPSGALIDADEAVTLPIPLLYGEAYYLTVGIGKDTINYEQENVPFVRPRYAYAIQSLEEMKEADVCPLMRFSVQEGVFSIDESFIPPYLHLSSDERYRTYLSAFTQAMAVLAEHSNLAEGEGKRLMMRYLFLLRGYHLQQSVYPFVQLTEEIAQAIDYYIISPNTGQPAEIPVPEPRDLQIWFEWFSAFLQSSAQVLDGVVLEDNTIDYEALLEQAKKELYERLNPELYERLLLQIKDELREEIGKALADTLTAYINDTLKPELEKAITEDLHERIFDNLFNELYDQLYTALYIPEDADDEFVPQI